METSQHTYFLVDAMSHLLSNKEESELWKYIRQSLTLFCVCLCVREKTRVLYMKEVRCQEGPPVEF